MRTWILLSASFALFTLLAVGCTETVSRQQFTDDVLRRQNARFPDDAVYMGDEEGYHYFKIRSIYRWKGDRFVRVPASQWELPVTFPLTDDANKWQSVVWTDPDLLSRSRWAYVTLLPSEPVLNTEDQPMLNFTTAPTTLPNLGPVPPPTTLPSTLPDLGAPLTLPSTDDKVTR